MLSQKEGSMAYNSLQQFSTTSQNLIYKLKKKGHEGGMQIIKILPFKGQVCTPGKMLQCNTMEGQTLRSILINFVMSSEEKILIGNEISTNL